MYQFGIPEDIQQEIEKVIDKSLIEDKSGKDIFSLYTVKENRRWGRLYANGVGLEEQIAGLLEKHNRYYGSNIKRADVLVIKESDDPTVELSKAQYRINIMVRAMDKKDRELEELRRKLKSMSPAVFQGAKAIAEDVLRQIEMASSRQSFISPKGTPQFKLSQTEKEKILQAYTL